MNRILTLVIAGMSTACVRDAVTARFADRPVVRASDDTHPIAEPRENPFYIESFLADALVFDPMVDSLDGLPQTPAGDVNALDEVPDSTWFTNRIGIRTVTPAEAARAAETSGPPVLPFTIVHAKSGGGNPGFIAADAKGVKFLIKFDTPENPSQQTDNDSIVARILWTAGYHTPSDYVVKFRRDQLVISPKLLAKHVIDDKALDVMLKVATHGADGTIRATASQFLDGIPKGGWSETGIRDDDPNDHVSHERRRVLRGLRVFAAWLNHTDMKDDNTLDMYVGPKGRGHLEHYFVDFGEAFGGHQSEHGRLEIGFEYAWDYRNNGKAAIAFGLWHRTWEAQRLTKWPSIGYFSSVAFDPWTWHERYPYKPFQFADRADLFWGAKLVMRFDRPMLEAIVATGEFDDPDAARYLTDVIEQRRDAIGRAWLDIVTPLDELTLTGNQLCGVDLAQRYGIAHEGDLVYAETRYTIAADGRACVIVPVDAGYHVARVQIWRHDHRTPVLEVHYMGGATPHIVGLVR